MTQNDQRKHARVDSHNLLYVCLDENNNIVKQAMGRTLNVSESGILLETHFQIDPNHIVLLTIGLEEDLVDIKGKPVHIRSNKQGKFEIGIQFFDSDKKAKRTLKKFIDGFFSQSGATDK